MKILRPLVSKWALVRRAIENIQGEEGESFKSEFCLACSMNTQVAARFIKLECREDKSGKPPVRVSPAFQGDLARRVFCTSD